MRIMTDWINDGALLLAAVALLVLAQRFAALHIRQSVLQLRTVRARRLPP
jgi:hypothetical protein